MALLCESYKALSDQNRLKILDILTGGETCACKLLEELNVTQPTLSHHMMVLQRAGLVNARKDGKWVHYSIDPKSFEEIRTHIDDILEHVR